MSDATAPHILGVFARINGKPVTRAYAGNTDEVLVSGPDEATYEELQQWADALYVINENISLQEAVGTARAFAWPVVTPAGLTAQFAALDSDTGKWVVGSRTYDTLDALNSEHEPPTAFITRFA